MLQGRIDVLKTHKMYVGGKFPRTESGRYYLWKKGRAQVNICRASRKDFRDAVSAARAAFGKWAGISAFHRSQVIYRIAEMLESRRDQFIGELKIQGLTAQNARREVSVAVDRLVYYAGWADKYQQVFSAVNPVASAHFVFSIAEPMGVVSIVAPEESALLGFVSSVAPVITGGNTCVVLASNSFPLCALSFAEVLNSSDVPGGVVNILTGERKELIGHFSSHMDVNAIAYCGDNDGELNLIKTNAAMNVKRVKQLDVRNWFGGEAEGPYLILDTQEIKTTWHPVGV